VEIKIEYKEKMLHREVDAKVGLGPGKGRIIIPGDFQNSTGQGPAQPDLPEIQLCSGQGPLAQVIQRFRYKKTHIRLLTQCS